MSSVHPRKLHSKMCSFSDVKSGTWHTNAIKSVPFSWNSRNAFSNPISIRWWLERCVDFEFEGLSHFQCKSRRFCSTICKSITAFNTRLPDKIRHLIILGLIPDGKRITGKTQKWNFTGSVYSYKTCGGQNIDECFPESSKKSFESSEASSVRCFRCSGSIHAVGWETTSSAL